MSDVTFESAMYSWLIFWITYWIGGIYFSYKARKIRPISRVKTVLSNLIMNMMWSFLGTVVIFHIPIRLDTGYNIVVRLLLCNLITEIWFYHIHIMVHHPQLYKRFHKQHHEFTHPYALTALYCTGYEAVVCNLFSVSLGPIMLNVGSPYIYIWFVLVSLNSTFTHSGLRLGWLMDGGHDLHHEVFKFNYGVLTLFDRLYGTYKGPVVSEENETELDELLDLSDKLSSDISETSSPKLSDKND